MNKLYTIEQIRAMLEGQRFFEWYQGEFRDYIEGAEVKVTETQVNTVLEKMLIVGVKTSSQSM